MEFKLLVWVVTGLATVAIYRLVVWVQTAPVTPDPWGDLVETETAGEVSQTLCWRCLEPVDEGRDFCAHCGLSVGPCTNLSPYLYLFALGDGLRTGTSGQFVVKPLTVAGFLLLSACQYFIFAPIFWVFLARNISRIHQDASQLPPVRE